MGWGWNGFVSTTFSIFPSSVLLLLCWCVLGLIIRSFLMGVFSFFFFFFFSLLIINVGGVGVDGPSPDRCYEAEELLRMRDLHIDNLNQQVELHVKAIEERVLKVGLCVCMCVCVQLCWLLLLFHCFGLFQFLCFDVTFKSSLTLCVCDGLRCAGHGTRANLE